MGGGDLWGSHSNVALHVVTILVTLVFFRVLKQKKNVTGACFNLIFRIGAYLNDNELQLCLQNEILRDLRDYSLERVRQSSLPPLHF